MIPQLCLWAAQFPNIKRCNFFNRKTKSKWEEIFNSLNTKLGKYALYWEVYDPYKPEDNDPLKGNLSDDLADIYENLKDGLLAWKGANAKTRRDIIWTWASYYESHWGIHATDAFRAIRWLLYYHICDEDGDPIGLRSVSANTKIHWYE